MKSLFTQERTRRVLQDLKDLKLLEVTRLYLVRGVNMTRLLHLCRFLRVSYGPLNTLDFHTQYYEPASTPGPVEKMTLSEFFSLGHPKLSSRSGQYL